jgi:hypothetical protein
MTLPYATGPKVRGFDPDRGRWIFKGDKNPEHHFFGGEVKLSVPCCRFTACKRTLRAWIKMLCKPNCLHFSPKSPECLPDGCGGHIRIDRNSSAASWPVTNCHECARLLTSKRGGKRRPVPIQGCWAMVIIILLLRHMKIIQSYYRFLQYYSMLLLSGTWTPYVLLKCKIERYKYKICGLCNQWEELILQTRSMWVSFARFEVLTGALMKNSSHVGCDAVSMGK